MRINLSPEKTEQKTRSTSISIAEVTEDSSSISLNQILLFQGHTKPILSIVSFKNYLITGAGDNLIKIWNQKTNQCINTLKGHKQEVYALVVLPNGNIASGSHDQTIKIWNLDKAECDKTLVGHTDWINALMVLPDGRLASASHDQTILLWNTLNGKYEKLGDHEGAIYSLVLWERELVSGSEDKTIKIWDIDKRICKMILEGHSSSINTLTVLASGELISGSDDRSIGVWEHSNTRAKWLNGHGDIIFALAVTTNGLLVSASCDRSIKFWNAKQGKLIHSEKIDIRTLAILPNGLLATGMSNGEFIIWDVGLGLTNLHIKSTELKLSEKISSGSYGTLFKAIWRGKEVAIKELSDERQSTESIQAFENEMNLLSKLSSPHIVRLYGYCLNDSKYWMVMEYMPKSLSSLLYDPVKKLPWKMRYKIILQIAQGVAYLHKNNILHRDIKSHNVMLDANDNAKLIDFGLARFDIGYTKTKTYVGTERWMAPELAREGSFTAASDIFSMGLTFYEIVSRRMPSLLGAVTPALTILWRSDDSYRDNIPDNCPPKITQLIQWCWKARPIERPTIFQVIEKLQAAEKECEEASDEEVTQEYKASYDDNFASLEKQFGSI